MIDEKKLLNRLNDVNDFKMSFTIPKECFEFVKYACETYHKKVCEFINEQPKIGEWIPCSERLPESRKDVLIQYHDIIVVGYFSDTQWYVSGYDRPVNVPCIAWQPLPEAYRIQDGQSEEQERSEEG